MNAVRKIFTELFDDLIGICSGPSRWEGQILFISSFRAFPTVSVK